MTTSDTTTQPNWFRRLITPPQFADDSAKTRAARFLNIIVLVLVPGLVLYAFAILAGRPTNTDIRMVVVGIALLIGTWLIMRRGWIAAAALLMSISWIAFVTGVIYQQGNIRAPIVSGYAAGIVITALLVGRRAAMVITGLILVILFAMTTAQINGNLPAPEQSVTYIQFFSYALIFIVVAVLLSLWSQLFNDAIEKLETNESRLRAQNTKLTQLQAKLEEHVAQRTKQLEASAEVGRVAAAILDENQLLREVVHLITQRFGFYYTAVFTLDASGKFAVLREATGEAGRQLKERGHHLEVGGQSMVGTAIAQRRARIVLDVGAEAVHFANPLLPLTHSEIALPLIIGDRVLGALDVQSTQTEAFDQASADLLQSMCNQIAVALSNSTQFEQTQTALRQTERLYQASAAMSEANNAAAVLQVLVDAGITDADRALLLLFESKSTPGRWAGAKVGGSWVRYPEDRPIPIGMLLPAEYVPFINTVTPNRPLIIQDRADPLLDEGYQRSMERLNIMALAAQALNTSGVAMGLLVLGYRESRTLTMRDIQPMQTLGTQMAVALYNQRLTAETQAAVQRLDEVNRRLTGQAWQEFALGREVLRKMDVAPGVAPTAATGPLPAQLTAPVTLRNTVIGTLRVEDARPDRVWTPDEQAVLQAVANDLSLAIENQRLIDETDRRAQRERLVSEISSKMFSQNDLKSIAEIAATELGRVLQISRAEVRIGAEALTAATPQIVVEAAGDHTGNGQSQEVQS